MRIPDRRRAYRVVMRAASLVVAAALGSTATAQNWTAPSGVAGAFEPDFLRRDLSLMAGELRLDESQQDILRPLFDDYEAAFGAGADRLRQTLTQMRPRNTEQAETRVRVAAELKRRHEELLETYRLKRAALPDGADDSDLKRQIQEEAEEIREDLGQPRPEPVAREELEQIRGLATEAIDAFAIEKQAMRAQFVEDVQAILVEEQLERWPAFERRLRRMKRLPRGQLSGESTDLLRVLNDLRLDDRATAPLAPLLIRYELDLDHALIARDDFLESSGRELGDVMALDDLDAAGDILDRQVNHRRQVRDVNFAAAAAIASELPATPRGDFERAAELAMFPRVLRPTQAERAFDAAAELEGLDLETAMNVATLIEAFRADLAAHETQLREALVQHEPDQLKQRMRQRLGGRPRDVADDPILVPFRRRLASGQQFLLQLRAILPPERLEEVLPGRRSSTSATPWPLNGAGFEYRDDPGICYAARP